ncbi:MAG: polyamine aminopropyltransferase [Bacteroidota bacterium]
MMHATEEHVDSNRLSSKKVPILLVSVLIIAICGILYELLISTITSYFQGSSILHFSIVIGLFLSSMGIGSYASRYIQKDLIDWFIRFEIMLGIIGGFATLLLYMAFSLTSYFYGVAFLLIVCLGSLIGLEIPILTRIVRQYESLKDAMAKVLSFDYLGALVASLAFPLILLPTFGTMRTAFFVGLLNLIVASINIWQFKKDLRFPQRLGLTNLVGGILLVVGFIFSFQLTGFFEQFLYQDPILLSRQTPYQQITLTQWNQDTRLFINGNLQFSSKDEYRYHEPLIHIPMSLVDHPEHVLVLGGGDGLAAKEIFKYPGVQKVTLVDLDQEMTHLGKNHPKFVQLNQGALQDERVVIANQDAYKFVEESSDIYQVVIIDLPDPNDVSLGKLYSKEFYTLLKKRIAMGGVIVTQSTSPYFAAKAFWCIHQTMESVFPQTSAYHAYVPTFGEWGYNLSQLLPSTVPQDSTFDKNIQVQITERVKENLPTHGFRYLSPDLIPTLFQFGKDMEETPLEINQLENQILVQYYEQSWNNWR